MSLRVTGRSEFRSRVLSESFELIELLLQAFSLETRTNLVRVDVRNPQDLLDIRHFPERPPGIVLHRVHLHRGQMLGPRDEIRSLSELQPGPSPRKDPLTRLS